MSQLITIEIQYCQICQFLKMFFVQISQLITTDIYFRQAFEPSNVFSASVFIPEQLKSSISKLSSFSAIDMLMIGPTDSISFNDLLIISKLNQNFSV